MRLGAKEGVGFDISDAAISEAEELAGIAKLNARFVRTNALEIDETYNDCFDFIYISQGSLQWFPDLNDYFSVISRLLKKDGKIIIFEIHPFKYFFENGFRGCLKNRNFRLFLQATVNAALKILGIRQGFLRFLPCILLLFAKKQVISLFSNKP